MIPTETFSDCVTADAPLCEEKMRVCQNDCIAENVSVRGDGTLLFAGQDVTELAARYGTPLYLMDERGIRRRCRQYRTALEDAFGTRCRVLYASKAASFKRLYEIMAEEGLGVDVVSAGEIETARRAGFPLGQALFHSNNKTDFDISFAMDAGVGCFVADNLEELCAVEREAASRGAVQDVLLRLTPGIDPHTYAAVATGKVDSKFGFAIETGQAEEAVREALALPHLRLRGFHCHVGSQVFSADIYMQAADVMLGFIAGVQAKYGFIAEVLDLGGGFGVRYTAGQPVLDIPARIAELAAHLKKEVRTLGVSLPEIWLEPGRSIVADAGMTLYTVGTVKRIPGYKTYVSVDGGMTDNIRTALYGAKYTILPAGDLFAPRDEICSVVGRCCESGDILQENVPLPSSTGRGDVLACLTTGAYHYSMASNYNRIPRPPVVMLCGGDSYVAVRRETLEDIVHLDN